MKNTTYTELSSVIFYGNEKTNCKYGVAMIGENPYIKVAKTVNGYEKAKLHLNPKEALALLDALNQFRDDIEALAKAKDLEVERTEAVEALAKANGLSKSWVENNIKVFGIEKTEELLKAL